MGGRGASSPSEKYTDKHGVEHTYGSEYTSVHQVDNIKFIIQNGTIVLFAMPPEKTSRQQETVVLFAVVPE